MALLQPERPNPPFHPGHHYGDGCDITAEGHFGRNRGAEDRARLIANRNHPA